MTELSLIPDAARATIGTVVATATGSVQRRDWQRWAAAVGDLNPLWFDADAARAAGYREDLCPPLYLQYAILGVTEQASLRPDGSSGAASGNLDFPDAPKRMAGGESWQFHAPAHHGDEITSERRVVDIVEKQGRSGAFVLVTWHTTFTNQHGDLLATAETSMIARP